MWIPFGVLAQLPYPKIPVEKDRNLAVEIAFYRLQLSRLPVIAVVADRIHALGSTQNFRLRYLQSEQMVTWGIRKGEHRVYNGRGDTSRLYTFAGILKLLSHESGTGFRMYLLRPGHLEIQIMYRYIGNAIYFDQINCWYFEAVSTR